MGITQSVKLENISKRFGKVQANKSISAEFFCGEVHAILGENGSGKSTLMNILSGIYTQDEGSLYIDEKVVSFKSPKDAINHSVGMVHQHFKLVDVLSARDNIVLGDTGSFFANDKKRDQKIKDLCEKYDLNIDVSKKVFDMSVSEKQTVEILKVLYRGAKLLILDEPTAVLTPKEIGGLFKIIRNMTEKGCAVIIITHKMNEVMEISDKITILRKGEYIKTVNTYETAPNELTELMVGYAVKLDIDRPLVENKTKVLEVENLVVKDSQGIEVLKNMSFDLSTGEILGIAGIAGSGQKELCESIAGLNKKESGDIIFKGESILKLSAKDIIKRGVSMSFIPEDRLGMGLVGSMNITDNIILKTYQNDKGLIVNRKKAKEKADEIIERFDVSTPSANHIIKKLSGGNIQKILLGREIDLNPELLITAYPVRGLDIGASYNIYDMLNEQKLKGVAVLFVGEDLDVLLAISDRIMVVNDGEIVDIVDARTTTKEEVGLLMMGHKKGGEKSA